MQEALSNEFSFGPQQIRAQARLGSAAGRIPEPCSAQGEQERAREVAAARYSTMRASSVCAKKMTFTVFCGGINLELKQSGKFGQPWCAVPAAALLLHHSWGRASKVNLVVT